jgi:hypothetical protein
MLVMPHRLSLTSLSHRAFWCAWLIYFIIIEVSCFHLQRNAAAGAPKQQDEDLVPDEYFDDHPS